MLLLGNSPVHRNERSLVYLKIHIVQKGDTIWEIAKKYGVDFEQVKALNSHLSSPDMIMPGMKIKIPSTTKKVKKEVSKVKETQQQPAPKPIQQIKEDDIEKAKPIQIQQPAYPQQQMPTMPMYPAQQYPIMPAYEKPKAKIQPKKEEKLTLPKKPSLDKSLGTTKKPSLPKKQPKEQPKKIEAQKPVAYPCYQAQPIPCFYHHFPCQPCSCGQQMMYHQYPLGGMYHPEQMYPNAQPMGQQPMPGYNHMPGPLPDWQGSQQLIHPQQQWYANPSYGGAQPTEQGGFYSQQMQPSIHDHQQVPQTRESYPTPPLYPSYQKEGETEETKDE